MTKKETQAKLLLRKEQIIERYEKAESLKNDEALKMVLVEYNTLLNIAFDLGIKLL